MCATASWPNDPSGRVLAVDYGRRRVGLAISDPTGTIASGLETLIVRDADHAVRLIAEGRRQWEYDRIVVGLPLLTSGDYGPMTDEVMRFVNRLRRAAGVPVETLDERFSSEEAQRILHSTGKRIKGNKGTIDRIAAELLLRHYLDRSAPSHGELDDEFDEDDS